MLSARGEKMLIQERHERILQELTKRKTISVADLVKVLNSSEATVRRDLNELENQGKLMKIHGGAMVLPEEVVTWEEEMSVKATLNTKEKDQIGRYAAGLLEDSDFVYLDAGSTTERMITFLLPDLKATFVTNGYEHARKLTRRGFRVYLLGGALKFSTEAIVGEAALMNLKQYNFTKCFLGVNGIHHKRGFTTPDMEEAAIKREAIDRSQKAYILCDHTKFGTITSVAFADLNQCEILTDRFADRNFPADIRIKECLE